MTNRSTRGSHDFQSVNPAGSLPPRIRAGAVAAALGLVVIFAVVRNGQLYRHIEADWRVEFTAMADATSLALEEWAQDRLADIRVVASTLSPMVQDGPPGPEEVAAIEAVLSRHAAHHEYRALWAIHEGGRVIASEGAAGPVPFVLEFARETIGERSVLRRGPVDLGDGQPTILMAAPLLTVQQLTDGVPGAWAVVLPADPGGFVIRALEAGTEGVRETERSGLVATRGDSVVILSPRQNGPVIVSGLADSVSPQVTLAAAGETAFGRFVDRDSGPVLASTRPVPGTEFGVIRQISVAEAFAPLRGRLLLEVFGLSTALSLFGLGFFVRSRRQKLADLQQAHTNLRQVVDHDPEAVVVFDADAGRFVLANERACDLLGYSPERLLELDPGEVSPERQPDGRPSDLAAEEYVRKALREGSVAFPWTHQHRDGTQIPCEVYLAAIQDAHAIVRGSIVDLREPRWAESALRRSEERAREREDFVNRVITSMTDGLSVVDPNGVLVQVNDAFCRMTGFSEQELIGVEPPHPFWSTDPDHLAAVRAASEAIKSGRFGDYELTYQRPDGERFPVIVSASEIKDLNGEVTHILNTVRDVSALRRAEGLARQTQSLLLESERVSGTGSWEWDLKTNEVRWSPEMYRQYGYTPEELPQPTFEVAMSLIDPEVIPLINEYVKASLAGEPPREMNYRLFLRDGTVKHVRSAGEVVRNANGEPVRMIGFVRDVTDQVVADEHLRIWESVYEAGDIGILIVDRDTGLIVRCNAAFATMHGYEPDELVGRSADLLIDPAELPRVTVIRKLAERGDRVLGEMNSIMKDGTRRPVEVEASEVYNEATGTRYRISLVRDITKRREQDEAMLRARQKLEALSRQLIELQENERQRLAQDLHDHVGQMLTALKLQLQMLQNRPDHGSRDQLFADAINTVERTIETTRDLSLALRPPMLDELGLVPAAEWFVRQFERQTGVTVHLDVDDSVKRLNEQAETSCYRILQEALTNVARHAEADTVWVRLGYADTGDLVLSIRDDGLGFEPETATVHHLGVVGMEERAQLAGGSFALTSTLGEGTSITVTFPRLVGPVQHAHT